MKEHFHRRSILHKTVEVGGLTFLSRLSAIFRDILLVRFLGIGGLSDAFVVAFKIPNILRKIFAEGALSAAIVPQFVALVKQGTLNVTSRFMSAAFLFFEGLVTLICIVVFFNAKFVVLFSAPFFSTSQIASTVSFLRILFPFILFISGSALLTGALQAADHFFIPAFAQVFQNIGWIITLFICLKFGLSATSLCWGVLAAGAAHFLLHLIAYFFLGFRFGKIDTAALAGFTKTLRRFGNCLFGVGVIEINLYIDTIVASYLPAGSITVLSYGGKFMRLPLGIFAVAFSTILLTHFSRVAMYAPKRLHYYLLEAIKFICWIILPVTLFFMFVSEKLFSTIIFAKQATSLQIWQAQWVFIILISGLLFFSLNKIIANVFYSLHDTWTPALAGIAATGVNLTINLLSIFFLGKFAIFGIALATTLGGIVQTCLSLFLLRSKYQFRFYSGNLLLFLGSYILQVALAALLFWVLFTQIAALLVSSSWGSFFLEQQGYWLLVLPLGVLVFLFLMLTRRFFRVKLHFLPS